MPFHHRIWILSTAICGFLLGCAVAEFVPWVRILPWLLVGFTACLVLVWPKIIPRLALVFIIMFGLGMVRWRGAQRAWNITVPYGEVVEVRGWVEAPLQVVSQGERTIVAIEQIKQGDFSVPQVNGAHIALTVPENQSPHYGDRITFSGKLQRLPQYGTFDGLRYWRVRGVQAVATVGQVQLQAGKQGNAITRSIYALRDYAVKRIQAILPGAEGSLLQGLLFGDQGDLGNSIKDAFRKLGISHLTAVSGYNLTIISLWPVALAGLLPKRTALLVAAVLVGVFVVFTGAPSSIVRAAIMAWVVLFGKYQGRAPHTLLLILLTACGMALLNPFVVKDDAGFGLSFLAFFGLVELGPLLQKYLRKVKPDAIRLIFAETMGAQIATLPYLLGVFGQFAFIAPLANLIILPLIPAIMLIGLSLLILALIPAKIFLELLGLLYFPLHAFLWVVQTVASLPHVSADWPRGGIFPWYLTIVIAGWWIWSKRRRLT